MPRLSDTAKLERRDRLVAVAEQLFLKNGYENTTVNQMVDELGMAKGSYYYHFQSKEDILVAVSERLISSTRDKLLGIRKQGDKDITWRIREVLAAFQEDFFRNKTVWKHVYHDRNAAMDKQVRKIAGKNFTPLLARMLDEANEQGRLDIPHTYEAAEVLMTLFDLSSRQLSARVDRGKRARIFETLRYMIGHILSEECIPDF